jgi:hypothetical protein
MQVLAFGGYRDVLHTAVLKWKQTNPKHAVTLSHACIPGCDSKECEALASKTDEALASEADEEEKDHTQIMDSDEMQDASDFVDATHNDKAKDRRQKKPKIVTDTGVGEQELRRTARMQVAVDRFGSQPVKQGSRRSHGKRVEAVPPSAEDEEEEGDEEEERKATKRRKATKPTKRRATRK